MLAHWALPIRQLGILRKRFRNAFIQTSLRLWGRDAKMLSMFQAGFAVIQLLGSPRKSFFDESESDGGPLTQDIWWHVSFMLFRPH